LRRLPLFKPFTDDTLEFMEGFKIGELSVQPGTTLLLEGSNAPQLYTVLSGMGLRYKTLEDGSRQVINFIFPGDFIGLQAGVMGEMQHSAEAATKMTLCAFERSSLWRLFEREPQRSYDLTWLGAVEEHFLGESLASVGQREGRERVAWALLKVFQRLKALNLGSAQTVPFPFRQQDLADTIGMSLVHTNKTLQRLRQENLLEWQDGFLTIDDPQHLADTLELTYEELLQRPLM
jgi:CRP/FNR family transcriptional regulator